jgi:fused signal recognition particle receptor
MSSFNWFRRSYDESSESPDDSSNPESSETDSASSEAAQADTTVPASADDYLQWAKAAYQAIQQQQTAEAQATEASEPDVSAPAVETPAIETPVTETPIAEAPVTEASVTEAPVTEASVTEASVTEVSVAEVPDTEASATEAIAPEVIATEVTELEPAVAPESAPTTETEEESTPEGTARPFWAQAEAEREARLERLKESAIATPAPPETDPDPDSPEALLLPDIDFDEAFLWSAEVLAAQGRRPDQISVEEITWLKRLRQGLDKTRRSLVNQLKAIVGQGPLNADAVMEIEALLLQADVGVDATDIIIEALQAKLREETLPPDQAIQYLKGLLREMLDKPLEGQHNLLFVPENDKLNIWLLVGVNGAGKTTTLGKLAHVAKKSGYRCLIGAADTFRAAAVEQVKVWGQRSEVEVIANPGQNTDPAAVVFDAITAAQARNTELLLIDTAGRLQNKKNLMDELSKVRRIIDKKAGDANVEALLVLDSTLGQNGIRQAQVFAEAASLSGVVLTKLDGTAKGGIALAVVQQLGLPIRFIGAGEGIEDLRPFSSYEFIEALLSG